MQRTALDSRYTFDCEYFWLWRRDWCQEGNPLHTRQPGGPADQNSKQPPRPSSREFTVHASRGRHHVAIASNSPYPGVRAGGSIAQPRCQIRPLLCSYLPKLYTRADHPRSEAGHEKERGLQSARECYVLLSCRKYDKGFRLNQALLAVAAKLPRTVLQTLVPHTDCRSYEFWDDSCTILVFWLMGDHTFSPGRANR